MAKDEQCPPPQPSDSRLQRPATTEFPPSDDSAPTDTVSMSFSSAVPEPGPVFSRGQCLGRYVLLSALGSGGMGTVYSAWDPELDRPVALKVLRADLRQPGRRHEAQARLRREAQAVARLAHPNVVTLYDVGEVDERLFLAMERIEGPTLSQWLRAKPRPWRKVLAVLRQVGEGLAAAHAAGLVHRDVKPNNVMLSKDGRAKLLDFGLAVATGSGLSNGLDGPATSSGRHSQLPGKPALAGGDTENAARDPSSDESRGASGPVPSSPADSVSPADLSSTADPLASPGSFATPGSLSTPLTAAGKVLGTPCYMAPERLNGEPADPRSDQFGFAATLFEALYGVPPYSGEDSERLLARMQAGQINSVPQANLPRAKTVPAWVRRALLRALAADPEQRFASMPELLAALDGRPNRQRRRWLAAAAIAAGVASTALTAGMLLGRREDPGLLCAGSPERLVGVWDENVQADLQAAFVATERPWVAATLPRTRELLDRYSEDWARGRQQACVATRVHREQSEAMMDRRMACYEGHLAALGATTKLLREADAGVVLRALDLVGSLPPVAACADFEALSNSPQPPEPSPSLNRFQSLVAESRALQSLARFGQAVETASQALTLAQTLQHPELEATALLELGRSHGFRGELEEMRSALARAAQLAQRVAADDLLAKVFTTMVVEGVISGAPQQASFWAEVARGAIARAGEPQAEEARRRFFMGMLADRQGELDNAASHYRAALDLLPEVTPLQRFSTQVNLGGVEQRRGQTESARQHYEQAGELLRQSYGPDHPSHLSPLCNLGSLSLATGDAEAALGYYQRAATWLSGPESQRLEETPGCLRGHGETLLALGDREQARDWLERSLALSEAIPRDPLALALTRFSLAKALPADQERRRTLAQLALETARGAGPAGAELSSQVQAWLSDQSAVIQ